MERVRTLVVADTAAVRAGLSLLLGREPSLRVQGEVPGRRDEILSALVARPAEAVLLDAAGSAPGALDQTLSALVKAGPSPALVVIGEQPALDVPVLTGAQWLPGWGYFLRDKGDGGAPLAAALRAAAIGAVVLDRHLHFRVCTSPLSQPSVTLTPRESEVLQLLAQGLSNKQIATRLKVTPHTAKFHVAQIIHKLDAESRTEAVAQAVRRRLVTI
jgi:DNA-binding NarL/FixJ family response regulator